MILNKVFNPGAICVDLESEDKEELFEELVEQLVSLDPGLNREEILSSVREREAKMSTGILPGIAVPHARTSAVKGVQGVIGISRKGIHYDSLDNEPVYLVFFVISSPDESEYHLQVLKRLSQLFRGQEFRTALMTAGTSRQVYDAVCEFDGQLATGI